MHVHAGRTVLVCITAPVRHLPPRHKDGTRACNLVPLPPSLPGTGPEKHRLCRLAKKRGKIFVFPGDKNLQSMLSFVPQDPLLSFLPPTLLSPRGGQLWEASLSLGDVAHAAVHLWACSFSGELGELHCSNETGNPHTHFREAPFGGTDIMKCLQCMECTFGSIVYMFTNRGNLISNQIAPGEVKLCPLCQYGARCLGEVKLCPVNPGFVVRGMRGTADWGL